MQLSLSLATPEPYSSSYFVPHSGMADAIEVLDKVLEDVSQDVKIYRSVFVYGAPGSGKTHLLTIYLKRLEALNRNVELFDCDKLTTAETVSAFVSSVEQLKLSGGVALIEGSSLAVCEIEDLAPHVNSRVLGGYAIKISQPQENELKPLILAILERRGLRFSDYSIEQLIRNLPAQTTTFNNIIQAIDEVSLREKQRITRGVITKTLKSISN